MNLGARFQAAFEAALGLGFVAWIAASPCAFAGGRVLFILDASGSMGMISADGRTRFEHAKDQVHEQAELYGAQSFEMGMFIFAHRGGGCGDIELKVPMSSSAWGAKDDINHALAALHPLGNTPLSKTIEAAAQYIKTNHLDGTEIIVVSDGGDNCGGNPIQAAQDLYAQTRSKISIIGMDISDHDLGQLQGVAAAGNGTFRREDTGTSSGEGIARSKFAPPPTSSTSAPALAPPSNHHRMPPPGSYSTRPNANPPTVPQGRREGAPDDTQPIIDPNSVPHEISFGQTPPKAPEAAPQRPTPPQPKPKPTEAPPEMLTTVPFLM